MEGLRPLKEEKRLGRIWRKTWERCKSFNNGGGGSSSSSSIHAKPSLTRLGSSIGSSTAPASPYMAKSKSWSTLFPRTRVGGGEKWGGSNSKSTSNSNNTTPKGCLSVYVGPDRERFVIKVKCTSHPLFKMLLEEAESEYGFHSDGPLLLPCDVDLFLRVLFQMESDHHDDHVISHSSCSPRAPTSYHPLSPSTSTSFLNYSRYY